MDQILGEIIAHADPAKAGVLQCFFKTGPGEYGEGDIFLGITVPVSRQIARQFRALPRPQLERLIKSKYHEARLIALLILLEQYRRGSAADKRAIVDFYLAHTRYINNWDLVDLSAYHIIGDFLLEKSDRSLIDRLAGSGNLWEERIAIVATFAFIRAGDTSTTYRLARHFLDHRHDLIWKATGWMLRECGKRVSETELLVFLDRYAAKMPRTMLRYSIERLSETKRQHYRYI